MVTSLERRRPVAIDNIPSVRNSRFSRHFLATRETIFAGDDRQPTGAWDRYPRNNMQGSIYDIIAITKSF